MLTVGARVKEAKVGEVLLDLARNSLLGGQDVLQREIVWTITLTALHGLCKKIHNYDEISFENFLATVSLKNLKTVLAAV